MLLAHGGYGLPPADKLAWLRRCDTDPELHRTLMRLLHPEGDNQPRLAEAVLLLEAHISSTVHVRSQVPGWSGDWVKLVTALSANRSISAVHAVQRVLRNSHRKG